ncbi:pyruvate decarboxylase [Penicillium canariense]|uniref:Pyruvate decarboxylase n=1 Tax=Penicillium canariense TaxID=189055 RepID=A0A9W9HLZ4_9EURO|nr:pyruvate decarboxylase [Penicillium canariense]KAJ5150916.1 pyruvate decarboxylase [Penicillium canariense]
MVNYSTLETIDLFEYLCIRIKQIGIRSVHGVPGDFNLVFLDYVEKCGLRWVGNCNELNAGYAADGYARINGISALMTVMGVGELSALNAIAGSFAEFVPVIHVVAKPSLHAQKEELCLHHTLGDGDFTTFEEMSRRVSCLTASIDSPKTAPVLIDEAIRTCWVQSRPVTIFIASDMVRMPIARHLLSSRPPLNRTMPRDDVLQHGRLVDTVIHEVQQATNPVLLIGGYGILHGAKRELDQFLGSSELPVLAAASGLGLVDATLPHYVGLYVGSTSSPNVLELMHSVDLVISIGNIQTDLSTSGFSGNVDDTRLIDIQRTRAKVKGHNFTNIHINNVLIALTAELGNELPPVHSSSWVDRNQQQEPLAIILDKTDANTPIRRRSTEKSSRDQFLNFFRNSKGYFPALLSMGPWIPQHEFEGHKPITHDWFWTHLGKWLRKGDIILAEAGTASYGIWNTTFPPDAIFLAQYLWSSIGYTIGACQGAALAARDSCNPQRRTILFIGDGSLQCGCQELSTIIRHGLTPIIGYTVERLIHGEEQAYNDIQPWTHQLLPAAFGAAPGAYQTHRVETREDLQALWSQERFTDCSVLQFVELYIAQKDAPSNLVALSRSLRERNG